MLDYHIHTSLCGHACGEMAAYIQTALARPLQEIGFADHLPMLRYAQPDYAMSLAQLPEYVQQVRQMQHAYPQLRILLGIEADYYPAIEDATRALLAQHPFDYVYGSVHFLDDWAIDDPRLLASWAQCDVNAVYVQYFTVLQQAIRAGLFDIIGHFDLVKKFGHRPTRDLSELIEETVRACRDAGVAVEINTAGLRKPVKELYPARAILERLKHYDVPIVFGSDSHAPDEVGQDFHLAREFVRAVGYTQLVRFERRHIVGTLNL
jgi:histidinol-phosphatase (PHP family)